jgi:hypothetical protein
MRLPYWFIAPSSLANGGMHLSKEKSSNFLPIFLPSALFFFFLGKHY